MAQSKALNNVFKLVDIVNVKEPRFGAKGDGTTDDTSAIQSAQNTGSALFFPAGTYLVSGITADEAVSWHGPWGATSVTEGAIIKAAADDDVILTVTDAAESQFRNLLFMGTSDTTEKGEDVTSIGVKFNCTSTGDIDAVFDNVGFIYLQDCVQVIGRNVRFDKCLFSNSKRGVYISGTQPSDVRGLEMYGCRFHSIGKTGASNAAAVYIDPAANFQEVVISGFDADDCLETFYGFSGMMKINGLINKARGHGIDLVATGHGASAAQRAVDISVQYRQSNATTVVASAVKTDATTIQLSLTGCTSLGSGGHGFDVNSTFAQITGCVAHNAGQATTNTYDGFYIGGTGSRITACSAWQDRAGTATNKARYGFNIQGDDCSVGELSGDSFSGGSGLFNRLSTNEVQGQEPRNPRRHEEWGTVAPAAGIHRTGDLCWNTAPVLATPVVCWVCIAGGTPGTWRPAHWIVSKNTTGNRPTPAASDIGVTYLDTTIDADGVLISWNGTAWVDATGATV